MERIEADIVAEAQRLLALAEASAVPLRLLGGVAIRLRAGARFPEMLARPYGDLDFVTTKGGSAASARLIADAGYEDDRAFNTLNGSRRLLFHDVPNRRKLDVFVGEFSMCHEIPVAERLAVDPVSVPLAELLLTKLQVVELNEKDVTDALALLAAHEVGAADGDTISGARVAALCASDWGLWRTITANLELVRDRAGSYPLGEEERARVREGARALLEGIEAAPKSRGWRLRARVGERVRWYELPEEVGGGG